MARLSALRYWMRHAGALADQLDAICRLTPIFGPLRAPGLGAAGDLSFFAPLTTDVNSRIAGVKGTFTRSSSGLYAAALQGNLAIAVNDESRHQYLDSVPRGLLAEKDATNLCENLNANPDAALSGISLEGDPAAVLSRVDDAAALADAGLSAVCSSGQIISLDNRAGAADAWIDFSGTVASLDRHTLSAYIRGQGQGNLSIQGGGAAVPGEMSIDYAHYYKDEIPDLVSRSMQFRITAGSWGYIILNQLEESSWPTTPIVITQGIATTRAHDECNWPELDANNEYLINHIEGMIAAEIRFPKAIEESRAPNNVIVEILSFDAEPTALFFALSIHPTNPPALIIRGNTSGGAGLDASVSLAGLPADAHIVIVGRWNQGTGALQAGYKSSGVWTWGAEVSTFNAFDNRAAMFMRSYWQSISTKDLKIWRVDNGTAWIESEYEGIAE